MKPKTIFFKQMDNIQKDLDAIRQRLYKDLKGLFHNQKNNGKEVRFEEDQPLVYHDGDSITIEGLFDEHTADGLGESGQRYDLSIAELGIDDVKAIVERLANEVL